MRRTKRQVQKNLKLAHLPDDAFMHLLTEAGDSDIVGGPSVDRRWTVGGPSLEGARVYSPEEISQAVVDGSTGNLLAEARHEAGRSLADIGHRGGVSRARIQQIEKSENIEVATLVRFASACGYDVAITLRPIDAKKRQLTTVLAG